MDHNRNYLSETEEIYRAKIFRQNFELVEKFNRENEAPELGITRFSDLTHEEFMMLTGQYEKIEHFKSVGFEHSDRLESRIELPDEINWVTKGAVTSVKDQLQCGSSPYFGAVVSIEGAWQIAGNQLVSLSEQQILDCSMTPKYGNYGCNGGYMYNSMQYVHDYGLETTESYPYVGENQACSYDYRKTVVNTSEPVKIWSDQEILLQEALVKVPVATAVDATQFQFYKSGIISAAKCGNQISHGIAVVGYGLTEKGEEYYILKNSWGTSWGLNGYIWIERNSKTTPACGVTTYCSYAVVQ